MDRLTFWELLAEEAPVKPARKRLKLEKIIDEPDVSKAGVCKGCAVHGNGNGREEHEYGLWQGWQNPHATQARRESLSRRVEEYFDRHGPQCMAALEDREVCEMFHGCPQAGA